MAMNEIYLGQISEMSSFLENQVSELDDELASRRPASTLNPAGFIYWHVLRIWDLDLNVIIGGRAPTEDAWHRGGFQDELGYVSDGKGGRGMGLGFGYSDTEVDEVPYRLDVIRQYHQQLLDETSAYLANASDDELSRDIQASGQPSTPAKRLEHTIGHSWNHIGELRMTKSLLGFHDPSTPKRGDG